MRHVWEPGNGTRYELWVAPFNEPLFGCPDGGWMVLGPTAENLRAMVVSDDVGLDWTYVAEKMRLSETDASFVTIMITAATGITGWPSERVSLDGLVAFKL